MNRIMVVTTTRADYGILRPLLRRMSEEEFVLSIAVGGTHLSNSFGYTINEIEADGYGKVTKFNYLLEDTSPNGVAQSSGRALAMFADLLQKEIEDKKKPDIIVLLGDRYEMLSIAEAALIYRIPIAHLHGGEITEGAIDDSVRHAITKLSTIHFASNEEHRKRIIQLGEAPDRVFNVGALGVEAIRNLDYMSKQDLGADLKMDFSKPYILMTYHPETASKESENSHSESDDLAQLLYAVERLSDYDFIITKANADSGGAEINRQLEEFAAKRDNVHLYDSLGSHRYLSVMKYAELVLGNSSSGIIEAPALRVPTINIGDRQKGRMRADSVIDVKPDTEEIVRAVIDVIKKKNESEYDYNSPYGEGCTSQLICSKLEELLKDPASLKNKSFYDL